MNLIVLAKAPRPGRSKTRLSPPCTPDQAAALAEAALADTLAAVRATPRVDPVLVLEGQPGPWLPRDLPVIAQRGDGLDERLAAAFDDVGGPAFLVGMDTPQLTSAILADAVARLCRPGIDAVLGPARDGGWWGVGLRRPDPRVFLGVPMSSSGTCDAQRTRLEQLGLSLDELASLRDVDVFEDALAVAASAPTTGFSRAMTSLRPAMSGSGP